MTAAMGRNRPGGSSYRAGTPSLGAWERHRLSSEHSEDCEEARQGETADKGEFEDQGESIENITHGLKNLGNLPGDSYGCPEMLKEAHMSRTPIKGI